MSVRRLVAGAFAAAFALLPLAAAAEGVNFTVPDHYLVGATNPAVSFPGTYRVWARSLNGVRHSIVVSSSPATRTLNAEIDATVASLAARNAIDVARSDGGMLCGLPSVRLSYAYANQLTYVYRYVVVGDRLLIASYAHPLGTDPDPAALASLETLCAGIYQPRAPQGWELTVPGAPNVSIWHPAGGGAASIAQLARPTKYDNATLAPWAGTGGTVVSTSQASCGAIAIRRATVEVDDGANVIEYAAGTAYDFDYYVVYKRPAADPADPNAMAMLTSFCEKTLPAN